jgi:DNA-binding ferritin-like protein
MEKAALLLELADIAICVHGDFHTMHLNMFGAEFDTMHAKVLQKYYDEAAGDYDSLAELASMYTEAVPNKLAAAERIGWSAFNGPVDRDTAVEQVNIRLDMYLNSSAKVYNVFEADDHDFSSIGIANWLQGRIEYWSKELLYFNKRRSTRLLEAIE